MVKLTFILSLASLISSGVFASESLLLNNLAYRSPSVTVSHGGLAHDVSEIARLNKRDLVVPFAGKLDFPYGVASGDPLDDSAILWTHPKPEKDTKLPLCLKYQTSTDKNNWKGKSIVDSGIAHTTKDVDYSVKVETKHLKPWTTYYYRFSACADPSNVSPIGRFKTMPKKDFDLDSLKINVFSCSQLPTGFFNAYKAAVDRDFADYNLHVGDYIYEYRGNTTQSIANNRVPAPDYEISSLQDYRARYASYRGLDQGLRDLHAQSAWLMVWDDHELADNDWKHGSHDSNDTVAGEVNGIQFSERKRNAVKAYYEWMPIRQVDTTDKLRIWRSFQVGKLADLFMMDTRKYDRDITDLYYNTDQVALLANDTNRSLMGGKQEKWLYNSLEKSQSRGATWKILGQQIIVNPLNELNGKTGNLAEDLDAWDGYKANRRRLFEAIDKTDNVIILAGDSHAAWVYDTVLPENLDKYDPQTGEGSVAVEFAGTAVSSSSSYGKLDAAGYAKRASDLVKANPNLQFAEGAHRGYFSIEFKRDELDAQYWSVKDNNVKDSPAFELASFNVKKGAKKLTRPINGGQIPSSGATKASA